MNTSTPFVLALALSGTVACAGSVQNAAPDVSTEPELSGYFGWPFTTADAMESRGGITRGAPVELRSEATPAFARWVATAGATPEERDRAAIAAMAGEYRVSFQFVELAGFAEGYSPPAPYFSWGTEHVQVLEEKPGFVSLQHTLVMYMQGESGEIEGPFVMKHWRQDWTYEDPLVLEFSPPRSWTPKAVTPATGTWTQAVYQVDDSPRYELTGRWQHLSGGPQFESDPVDRPLPRREFSVRSDYNVLDSDFRITVSPGGWVHETFSRKVNASNGSRTVLATETGVNRYENITSPALSGPAMAYWEKAGPYWQVVRNQWNALERAGAPFTLQAKVEGKKLWEHHFTMAGELEAGKAALEEALAHAEQTVQAFVVSEGNTESDESPKAY